MNYRIKLLSLFLFIGLFVYKISEGKANEITFSITSIHFNNKAVHNNFNPGMGFRLDNGFISGGYYNSNNRISLYVGYQKDLFEKDGWRAGFLGAIATGYNNSVQPAFGLTFGYRLDKEWSIGAIVIPSKRGVITFGLAKEF